MFRTIYDADVTTFSPEGEILQINYANKACERANMTIGIKCDFHCFLISIIEEKLDITKQPNKILSVAENFGILVSGIIGDGKYVHKLVEHNKNEFEHAYNRPAVASSIVLDLKNIFSQNTFHSGTRPFGVSLILGGYDFRGPQLFLISPDGTVQKKQKTINGGNKKQQLQAFYRNLNKLTDENQIISLDEIFYCFSISVKNSFPSYSDTKILLKNNINLTLIGKKTSWVTTNEEFNFFMIDHVKQHVREKDSSILEFFTFNIFSSKVVRFYKLSVILVNNFSFLFFFSKIYLFLKKRKLTKSKILQI